MPAYRLPRPGDLLAVRTTSPYEDEQHIVLDRVADNGNVLVMSGRWGDSDLEVVLRRVGDADPLN